MKFVCTYDLDESSYEGKNTNPLKLLDARQWKNRLLAEDRSGKSLEERQLPRSTVVKEFSGSVTPEQAEEDFRASLTPHGIIVTRTLVLTLGDFVIGLK